MDTKFFDQDDLKRAGFTPGPWMVMTGCDWKDIFVESGERRLRIVPRTSSEKPVLMPIRVGKGKKGKAAIKVAPKDLQLCLAATNLLSALANLMPTLKRNAPKGDAYIAGMGILTSTLGEIDTERLLDMAELQDIDRRMLRPIGVSPGSWGYLAPETLDGAEVGCIQGVTNSLGEPVITPIIDEADGSPDISGKMKDLHLMAAAPEMLVTLMDAALLISSWREWTDNSRSTRLGSALRLCEDLLGVAAVSQLIEANKKVS